MCPVFLSFKGVGGDLGEALIRDDNGGLGRDYLVVRDEQLTPV